MTWGFTTQEVMTGRKNIEYALMLHLDLLGITPAQTRQSFSLLCGSHCPVAHRNHTLRYPDDCHHTGDQLLGGTTRATVLQPLLGPLPSILSQENRQEEQRRGSMTFHNTLWRQLHNQLSGEEQFQLPGVEDGTSTYCHCNVTCNNE